VLDEIRNVGADPTVGECGVLFRDGRCDVLPVDLGKTEYQLVNKFADSGFGVQWGHTASLRPARYWVNADFGRTRPVSSPDGRLVFTKLAYGGQIEVVLYRPKEDRS
jgi:hypothetical protein